MAGSCSTDLRSRVLAAMEAGENRTAEAKRFTVGRSSAYRWAQAAHDEGRREAKRMDGGLAPRIADAVETAMLDLLRGEDNHLALAHCCDLPQIALRFRWLGRSDGRAGPPLDGGPGAAAGGLDMEEAHPAWALGRFR